MIALHHQIAAPARPYDYRVAYIQRISSGANMARFSLPSMMGLNPAITDTDAIRTALKAADWRYSVTCGFAPGSTLTGDRHLFGGPGWYAFCILNSRWRPGGVMTWPPQIPTANIPLAAGVAVAIDYVPSGYVARDSSGHEYTCACTHNPPSVTAVTPVLLGENGVTAYPAVGCRFFACSVRNDSVDYGFEADYIPVMKDGEPYIYDRVSGTLHGNLGGTEYAVGPKVADGWDPMDWIEP